MVALHSESLIFRIRDVENLKRQLDMAGKRGDTPKGASNADVEAVSTQTLYNKYYPSVNMSFFLSMYY